MKDNTQNKKEELHINPKMALAALLTFILLIGSLVPVFVGVTMDMIAARDVDVIDDGGDKNKPDKDDNKDKPAAVVTTKGSKTGIELPSQTVAGIYLGVSNDRTQDITGDTDIKSAAAVLVDIKDNVVVAGKNADTRIYPASMTKVMTLLVACENAIDPNALLTLTKEMVNKYNSAENQGASLAFVWKEGYQITVEDALHMIIYESDTYACWLMADHIAGSEEAFADLMNQKARDLGLTQTHFTNCTGLYNENHYTTCREMAAIMAAAMNNAAATAVLTKIEQYHVDFYVNGTIDEEASATASMWSNWYAGRVQEHPYVAPNGKKATIYVGNGSDVKFIAGKTGYESIPRNCFVSAGMDDQTERRYVCVQVGRINDTQNNITASESTADTRVIYQKYAKEPEAE